jgi:hypothetical protein
VSPHRSVSCEDCNCHFNWCLLNLSNLQLFSYMVYQ